jgi:hypothetical protein
MFEQWKSASISPAEEIFALFLSFDGSPQARQVTCEQVGHVCSRMLQR